MDTNEAKIFYDALAEDYDKMTRFEQRLENEALMLKKWVEKYNIRSALDAACGTGLHAILLSRWGIETVGCDISPAMLEKARKNAKKFEANVEWIESDMQSLGEKFQDRVVLQYSHSRGHPGDSNFELPENSKKSAKNCRYPVAGREGIHPFL